MAAQVNGDVPSSAFLQHLLDYPVIHDGVATFKKNQYGQMSLKIGDSAYNTFAKPVIPFLSRPYQYVSPYAKRVDDIGNNTLAVLDERFPIVKKPTGEIFADAKTVALLPYRKGIESKEHVFTTYEEEFKKVGGGSIAAYGKAAISTTLIIGSEALSWLSNYVTSKKVEAKEEAGAVMDKASN